MNKPKKIGLAIIDSERELWTTREHPGICFQMNRRLIEIRPEYKAVKRKYAKEIQVDTPARYKIDKRKAYFEVRDHYRKEMQDCIVQIFQSILSDSQSQPIALRKEKDYAQQGDWRFCLYKGIIYQFDKPGYSSGEMLEGLEKLEAAESGTPGLPAA